MTILTKKLDDRTTSLASQPYSRTFSCSVVGLATTVFALVFLLFTSTSGAKDAAASYTAFVKPTLSKVAVTEYIWIRNFQRFSSRDEAIAAACQFVDYNTVNHRCPVDVKLAKGKFGYGLYVLFNKKSLAWENFSTHIEKFDVVEKVKPECAHTDYQVAIDIDQDGQIDRCLPNAQISSL